MQVQQRRTGGADGDGKEAALGGEVGGLEAPRDGGGLLSHEAQRPPHVHLPAKNQPVRDTCTSPPRFSRTLAVWRAAQSFRA